MYVEYIGKIDEPLRKEWAPICLTDPDITMLGIEILEEISNITPGIWRLLRVFISDEDASYLSMKYPTEAGYVFEKI